MSPNIPLARAGLMVKPNTSEAEKYALTRVKKERQNEFLLHNNPNYYVQQFTQ